MGDLQNNFGGNSQKFKERRNDEFVENSDVPEEVKPNFITKLYEDDNFRAEKTLFEEQISNSAA